MTDNPMNAPRNIHDFVFADGILAVRAARRFLPFDGLLLISP